MFEHQDEYDSQWKAVVSVASKLGMTPETLRHWIKQAEIDEGKKKASQLLTKLVLKS